MSFLRGSVRSVYDGADSVLGGSAGGAVALLVPGALCKLLVFFVPLFAMLVSPSGAVWLVAVVGCDGTRAECWGG